MGTKFVRFNLILFTILFFSQLNYAQAPNLGSLTNFVLFSSEGAVGNTGVSHITGDIGTNMGAITGFDLLPSILIGVIHNANAITLQAKEDLALVNSQLLSTTATVTTHGAVFGGGETLFAGVYEIGAAGSLDGNLILDAQSNPDAVFIFKFGGAFTTAAAASVTLINGAMASNVFWIATSEIAMATKTAMRGTLIANGANSLGAGGTLVGRMLSTAGAVTINGSVLSITPFAFLNPGEIPDLGAAASFVLYTSSGAVGNTDISHIVGDIGTNAGAINNFVPPNTLDGTIYPPGSKTLQALYDLKAAYLQIINTTPTVTNHAAVFGNGETLGAGVYSTAAAGTVAGELILDAQGDPNAVFIFTFGGAFTTAASTTITLLNGAQASRVYWAAEGEIAMAATTIMKGTLIANNGAISLGAGSDLEGRMLSTIGAAAIDSDALYLPGTSASLPIELFAFTGTCDKQRVILKWSTATERSNDYFSVERKMEGTPWQVIGTIAGNGNTTVVHHYSLTDKLPNRKVSIYRLKQTDWNGNFRYSQALAVKNCWEDLGSNLIIYPNPSDGRFELLFNRITSRTYSYEIFDSQGRKIYKIVGTQTEFDISGQPPGIYYMNAQLDSKIINLKFMIL